jgi:hypothetical protein
MYVHTMYTCSYCTARTWYGSGMYLYLHRPGICPFTTDHLASEASARFSGYEPMTKNRTSAKIGSSMQACTTGSYTTKGSPMCTLASNFGKLVELERFAVCKRPLFTIGKIILKKPFKNQE